ncbi:MAG: hypothetical protein A2Y92_00055 [Chloroflexi bacterium RBG_13_57_8]|nr:MAG: hypothetical protein A2Y92_00055 [Chloroflexi bacterium RBG_13_57_8]
MLYSSAVKRVISVCIILSLVFALGLAPSGWHRPAALAATGPDLVISDISLSPPYPAIGDAVIITATVKNQGTEMAFGSRAVCYIDDAILATNSIDALDAGEMATTSFPWEAPGGSHIIRAVADSGGAVPESDESNNTMTYSMTTLAPDLVVLSVSWTPTGPSKGDNVSFRVTVKNQGNSRSGANRLIFYIDGNSRGYKDIYPIEPANTTVVTYSWVAQAGQHALKAVVDEAQQVEEGNEANNEYNATFTTLPPDLVVKNVTWVPGNPSKNDVVSFSANVTNQGSGRSDSCQLAYYIDGQVQSTLLVPSLAAGMLNEITFTWTATTEMHEVKVIVDSAGTVAESDENNNIYTSGFITLLPDLVVTDITWAPENAGVGDTVTFTATVMNQGTGRSESARINVYVSGSFSGYVDIGEIEAEGETDAVFDWTAVPGTFTVKAVADGEHKILESKEDNNDTSRTIIVIPPDISFTSVTWSPVNPPVGDIVTFTANLTNLGGGAAGGFYLAYYLDGEMLSFDFVTGILTGDIVSQTCEWKAQNGRHIFKAVADYNFMIAESNEKNNETAVTVTPLMPDITVGNITWSPADMPVGVKTTFAIEIENTGTLNAGASRVTYYTDGAIAGYNDIDMLEAGAVVTKYFPWTVAAGSHSITITTDSGDQVAELDEINNTKVITLPLPDLVVTDVEATPQAAIGDNVTFSATVKNIGVGASRGTLATCYVDGIAASSAALPDIEPGNTARVSFVWEATSGNHAVTFRADSGNLITEVDETNNDLITQFATLTPDLLVDEIEWYMENPLVTQAVVINIVVANKGTDITGDFHVLYSLDDDPETNVDMVALSAGGTVTVSITPLLTLGPHKVSVSVDTGKDVIELDENNNVKTITFSTIGPDLVIKSITWPARATAGNNVTISVDIENQGTDKAGNSRLDLYVNGKPFKFAEIGELAIGESVVQDFTWASVAGPQEISAYADIDGLVPESNEVNNTRSRTISLTKPEPTPTKKTIVDLSSNSPEDSSFISNSWWMFLLGAILLGVGAFLLALKSLKKEK